MTDDTDTTLGKRKANNDEVNENTESTPFKLIPDVCWHLVAHFAAPPDVYNLCLCSKTFFREAKETGAPSRSQQEQSAKTTAAASPIIEHLISCGFSLPFLSDQSEDQLEALLLKYPNESGSLPRKYAKPDPSSKLGASSSVLATHLLRSSLLISFRRVLEHSDSGRYSSSGITLEAALAMGSLPDGYAIIAGSTIVQTILGVVWDNGYGPPDVDVFCSTKGAPHVRSWLVDQANSMFVGFKDYGVFSPEDVNLIYTVDTNIHHVEVWGSILSNYEENSDENNEGIDVENVKKSNYYKEAVGYGKNCQKNYADWKWQNSLFFDLLGADPKNEAYHIKPKPRGDLPFDFRGNGNIDLVVAKKDKTAYQLLDDFDLTICKASWNGRNFKIPNPHQSFCAKSTYDPIRCEIVNSYLKHFNPAVHEDMEPSKVAHANSTNASAVIQKVQKDVPRTPFYRYIDKAKELPDRYNPNAEPWDFSGGTFYDYEVQAKHGASLQFHNWTTKLLCRLEKYQKDRGIVVIGGPTVRDDVKLQVIEMMPFGG